MRLPAPCLPCVKLDPRHGEQFFSNQVVKEQCPGWGRQDVHVVQKGEQFLPGPHLPFHFNQSVVDRQAEQEWHQRSFDLFAPPSC